MEPEGAKYGDERQQSVFSLVLNSRSPRQALPAFWLPFSSCSSPPNDSSSHFFRLRLSADKVPHLPRWRAPFPLDDLLFSTFGAQLHWFTFLLLCSSSAGNQTFCSAGRDAGLQFGMEWSNPFTCGWDGWSPIRTAYADTQSSKGKCNGVSWKTSYQWFHATADRKFYRGISYNMLSCISVSTDIRE